MNFLKRFFLIMLFLSIGMYQLEAQLRVKEINRQVSPAVVAIQAYDQNDTSISYGSGFLITHTGLVVTNYHVIKGAIKAAVKTEKGDIYWVRGVVSVDAKRDFVILKIDGYGLPVVRMGNSNQVEQGDEVVAIGNPQGLENSLSTGVISQTRRIQSEGYTMFQITAPISQGSSGGPLIDMNGQVIGITTSSLVSGQNLNFALPINYVRGVIGSDSTVKYTLPQVAEAQAKIDQDVLKEKIAELFVLYTDPDELFSMVCPREWRIRRSDGWDKDKTVYTKTTMMAPRDAYRAEIDGYLSEGIRFTFSFPPKGRVWTMDTVDEYAEYYKSVIVNSNPGFAITESTKVDLGTQSAYVISMVGQNENIPEPEKTTFIIFADKKYYLTIELVSPTSKLQSYETIYFALLESLELSSNIELRY